GQEKADGFEFLLQQLHRRPRLDGPEVELRGRARSAAKQVGDTARRIGRDAMCEGHDLVDVAMNQSAVCPERVKGASGGQRLEGTLVERLRIEPAGEVGQILERSVFLP